MKYYLDVEKLVSLKRSLEGVNGRERIVGFAMSLRQVHVNVLSNWHWGPTWPR